MSRSDDILDEMASRLFEAVATQHNFAMLEAGDWPAEAWQQVEDLGLTLALVREGDGGVGIDPSDAARLIRLAGRYVLPLPLAETMLANRLIAAAGIEPVGGVVTFAGDPKTSNLSLSRSGKGWQLIGSADRVPWARQASTIAVVVQSHEGARLARVPATGHSVVPGSNIANERRDNIRFDLTIDHSNVAALPPFWSADHLRRCGAAIRALGMAGALETLLTMTVAYAGEREQFGRPIGRFQAVQQSLAVMAGHVAAALSAADLAVMAIVEPRSVMPGAIAKSRIGEAATVAAAIAHQVHGAIGFTREHALNRFTRRLWAWRDEFGGEAEWNRVLGRSAFAGGADGLWPLIVSV